VSLNLDSLAIRQATHDDAANIATLFAENGNPYNWTADKWLHYYQGYTEGDASAIIAEFNGKVIGHYGLLPVKLGFYPAFLGMHAYVAKDYRGLSILSPLMSEVDSYVQCSDAKIICGFANPQFSLIKKTFFQWKILLWLGFKSSLERADLVHESAKFYFSYSKEWFHWRFGEEKNAYVSRYVRGDGESRIQFLKAFPGKPLLSDSDLVHCEGWSPKLYFDKKPEKTFAQPFSTKVYDKSLIEKGIYDPSNWFLEMGDSDTFQYNPL